MIRIELPLPPSVNKWHASRVMYAHGKPVSRIYKTKEQKAYVTLVQLQTKHISTMLGGQLCYHLTLYFPDNRRRDGSNYLKALEDSLNGVVWLDDSQIKRRCVVDKVEKQEGGGRCVLWVASISEWRRLLESMEGVGE